MKSILHVALIAPGGYSNAGLMKAFFDNGFSEYTCFDFQEKTFNSDRETMRKMLIKEAERLRPDMIFMQIQASDILDVDTFKSLSKISFTVNYTFDIRTVEQTEWLYNLASILGLICFSNQRDVDICNAMGFPNAMVLQSSVDTDDYFIDRDWNQEKLISFIGTNYLNTNIPFPKSGERNEMVERLTKKYGDRFGVWGVGWNNSRLTKPTEERDIYNNSKIAINHNNFNEELYTSDRIWRIMACGTLCLTSYFKGIENLFTRYEHLDWWETIDELEGKIDHYFNNPELSEKIRNRGWHHFMSNHTWMDRIGEVMDFVDELKLLKDYVFRQIPDKDACTKSGAHVIDGIIPQPLDEQFNGRTCDCKKTKWVWAECGCGNKEFQLRAQENI